jgi:GTP cyclohydrolase I
MTNMKQNSTPVSLNGNGIALKESNGHHSSLLLDTLPDIPELYLDDDEKMRLISRHFKQIMLILGLDLNNDSLKETPERVAKMYVKEMFAGLNPSNKPNLTLFENKYRYDGMVLEKNISIYSCCEHHFVPITGKAHIAYFSGGKVIGLSKINRLAQFYSKRPQVQERLTEQIAGALKETLMTEDVAVMIDATHHCVASRGVNDITSSTITSHYSGKFKEHAVQKEFLLYLK